MKILNIFFNYLEIHYFYLNEKVQLKGAIVNLIVFYFKVGIL